jgi:hypothetical protein
MARYASRYESVTVQILNDIPLLTMNNTDNLVTEFKDKSVT